MLRGWDHYYQRAHVRRKTFAVANRGRRKQRQMAGQIPWQCVIRANVVWERARDSEIWMNKSLLSWRLNHEKNSCSIGTALGLAWSFID
jgi:hypothetical protein